MSGDAKDKGAVPTGVQVCVRVRPVNDKERSLGLKSCVSFDEPSKQVVLTALDKTMIMSLKSFNKGYAFDRRYGPEDNSGKIYEDCVGPLVEKVFQGYNATVLAYGQTGTGKTLTMSGGVTSEGTTESGIIPRVAAHIFAIADKLKERLLEGEALSVTATALELYNEELRDLSAKDSSSGSGTREPGMRPPSASPEPGGRLAPGELRLQERTVAGKAITEVIGSQVVEVEDAESLVSFFADAHNSRAVSSTNMNQRSSRSHAIYTICVSRTTVEISAADGKVRAMSSDSKFHLVDLAGSERVKRSGVTGKELKEATHINGGLLALGNVISALSEEAPSGKEAKRHIPYRDSKLTRLLQDSLGGSSLTVLISCISACEADFEETHNTLKYANRACKIKNTPLAHSKVTLEEDLMGALPSDGFSMGSMGAFSMVQMQALLQDHGAARAARQRYEAEKKEKEEKRAQELKLLKEADLTKPGAHRLRAQLYDETRKKAVNAKGEIPTDPTRSPRTKAGEEAESDSSPSYMRSTATRQYRTSTSMSVRTSMDGGSARRKLSTSTSATHRRSPSVSNGKAADMLKSQEWQVESSGASSSSMQEGEQGGESGAAKGKFKRPPPKAGQLAVVAAIDPEDSGSLRAFYPDSPDNSSPGLSTTAEDAAQEAAALASEQGSAKPQSRRQSQAGATVLIINTPLSSDASSAVQAGADAPQSAVAASQQAAEQRQSKLYSQEHSPYAVLAFNTPKAAEPEPEVAVEEPPEEETSADDMPRLLARFKVNEHNTIAVFTASTKEDFSYFRDVVGLLPANTPGTTTGKMTYLIARLEADPSGNLEAMLQRVASGAIDMDAAVGPAVGCMMATVGTALISNCIFEYKDPEAVSGHKAEERVELWGLQIPHTYIMPADPSAAPGQPLKEVTWASKDRIHISIGLLYALCNLCVEEGAKSGFCVPRPQLLKHWLQAGIRMHPVTTTKLIYPPTAHDHAYYKGSTVTYFLADELSSSLAKVLSVENRE